MNSMERCVKRFKKEFKIKGVPVLKDFERIIIKLSYSLLPSGEMQNILTPDEIASLNYSSAITISKGKKHYIFYDCNILKQDLLFVLAHEIGHIYLNHLNRNDGYYDTSEHKQQEANEFATYLMNERNKNYLTPAVTAVSLVIILHLLTVISSLKLDLSRSETAMPVIPFTDVNETEEININKSADEVIVTSTGKKYHKSDCGHIKNRENLKTITIKKAIKQGYEECLDCF